MISLPWRCAPKLRSHVKDDDPKLHHHPVRRMEDYASRVFPFVSHGDGVSFQDRDSLMTLSAAGLVGDGTTSDSTIFITSWPKHLPSCDSMLVDCG